jgi:hypothetical protein
MKLSTEEVHSLIAGYLADMLDDAQRLKLKQAIENDDTARKLYLEYMDLNASLCRQAQPVDAESSIDLLPQDILAALSVEPGARPLPEKALSPLTTFSSRTTPRVRSSWTTKWALASLCGIAASCLAFAFWGLNLASTSNKSITIESPAVVREVVLAQGSSTKLQIENVGHLTLYGPAKFQLLGPKRARLENGRIRMRVTEKSGHGFVVETPDGDIVDLGTEFGVDVTAGKNSALAVFEGAVDLKIADVAKNILRSERLLGGDGVLFSKHGQWDRLNSVMTGVDSLFQVCGEPAQLSFDNPLIVDVYDNLPSRSTKRYYEIVPRGMQEDVLAFVDRLEHNWNGMTTSSPIPRYLLEGDYVKTFNADKTRDFKLTVVLSRPANLYVLFDKRLAVPNWLQEDFEPTGDSIGLDTGRTRANDRSKKSSHKIGKGPGESIDHEFAIWKREVQAGQPVVLGENGHNPKQSSHATMYGVVAKDLTAKKADRRGKKVSDRALSSTGN